MFLMFSLQHKFTKNKSNLQCLTLPAFFYILSRLFIDLNKTMIPSTINYNFHLLESDEKFDKKMCLQ